MSYNRRSISRNSTSLGGFAVIFVFVIAMLAICSLLFKGCSADNSEATRALETNGFTNVSIRDSGMWGVWHGCDKHDGAWYEASATNPIGKPVSMVVCRGGPLSFKGCTVRSK